MNRYLAILSAFIVFLFLPLTAGAIDPEEASNRSKVLSSFDLRVSLGRSYCIEEEQRGGFALDVDGLGRFQRSGMGILAELGYSLVAEGVFKDQYAVGGLGFGFMGKWYTVGVVPALVMGKASDANGNRYRGVGYRTTLLVEVPYIIGVHASHQVFTFNGETINEFRLSFSLHFYALIGIATGL